MEGTSIDVTFTAQFLEGETLESINIIDYEATPGVLVEGARIHGSYNNVFALGNNALQYRTIDGRILSANEWDDLPSASDTQLFNFKAPRGLTKTFKYTVELIYWYQAPTEPGGAEGGTGVTPPPVQRKTSKVYTKVIVGNWDRWANKLRSYVYARP